MKIKLDKEKIDNEILKNLIIYRLVQDFTKNAKYGNKIRIFTLWKNLFFKNRLKYRHKSDNLKIYGRLSKIFL